GTSTCTADASVTVKPASNQTAFYFDPTYTGGNSDGSAAHPWTSPDQIEWRGSILTALASSDVIVYFSARQVAADMPESITNPLWIDRPGRCGLPNTPLPCDTTVPHRLTLDGMSVYNTNDAAPNWVTYTGTNKFKLADTGNSMALGW